MQEFFLDQLGLRLRESHRRMEGRNSRGRNTGHELDPFPYLVKVH